MDDNFQYPRGEKLEEFNFVDSRPTVKLQALISDSKTKRSIKKTMPGPLNLPADVETRFPALTVAMENSKKRVEKDVKESKERSVEEAKLEEELLKKSAEMATRHDVAGPRTPEDPKFVWKYSVARDER